MKSVLTLLAKSVLIPLELSVGMLAANAAIRIYNINNFFLSFWVFFYKHSRITGLQRKGEGISLTPHYQFHPLHRHLDIRRAITAESSPLHIEFLDDRIHILINDDKIINKLNRNADSYFVNSELVDLKTPNLLKSSQSVQRVTLAPTDSLPNSNDKPALVANKTLQ